MAIRIKKQEAWSVPSPPPGHIELFVDEQGFFCLMQPDGTVNYVVLTTIPPISGAMARSPVYMYDPPPGPPPEPMLEPPREADKTLWDHLGDQE